MDSPQSELALPYPPLEPFSCGRLDVGDGHQLHHEQSGRPDGPPLLYLHGGPGSGCTPRQRQLFDPTHWRIVMFDQRGCGRSTPRGCVRANTSEHLISDIERLRRHLAVDRWLVVGGSWGAGLALAYAAAHPHACAGLILRAPFLGRAEDLEWFFQDAQTIHPAAWSKLRQQMPRSAGNDVLTWLHAGLHEGTPAHALRCALAWRDWEAALSDEAISPDLVLDPAQAAALVDKYRVQSHYLVHGCFWGSQDLLSRARDLVALPCIIVQGDQDLICRPQAALDLHAALPASRLQWAPGGSHRLFEAKMLRALNQAVTGLSPGKAGAA